MVIIQLLASQKSIHNLFETPNVYWLMPTQPMRKLGRVQQLRRLGVDEVLGGSSFPRRSQVFFPGKKIPTISPISFWLRLVDNKSIMEFGQSLFAVSREAKQMDSQGHGVSNRRQSSMGPAPHFVDAVTWHTVTVWQSWQLCLSWALRLMMKPFTLHACVCGRWQLVWLRTFYQSRE